MFKLLLLLFALPAFASDEVLVQCDYAFMGVPTSKVQFSVYKGELGSSVSVTMPNGATHKETLTPEKLGADEFMHGWISKENPQNTIEIIVYQEAKSQGQSVLINHNVPIGKEMWGTCTGVPAP